MKEQPNLGYINQLSGGDKSFEEKLISIIKNEFPEEKAVYYKNIKSNNFIEASENVHKLKHKISILGLEKSYELATQFENSLRDHKNTLEKEFDEILQSITAYLATL